MFDMWWMVAGIAILAVLSIYDIRTRRIPACGFAVVFIFSIVSLICFGDGSFIWMDIFLSTVPGLVLIGLGIITEGKVGIGDGILVAELGPALGFERCVYMLTGALIFNCIFAGGCLALKKAGPGTRIPFVPFITLSMGVILFVFR
ncbi:Type IV leader peptidase family protein [Lachnospiraceae bacterium XBB2008]|nr:Type IV leader peptidase family protein [Lachnospiraceae bacterium XBB2008]